MFSIETASMPNVADFYMTSRRHLLYGVVELNAKEAYAAGAARRILSGAIGIAADADEARWPAAMAEGVQRTLDGLHTREYPSHVMGAFLSLSDGLVRLCWAGTLRVHLIRRGAMINVTHGHNVTDDPVEGLTASLLSESPDRIDAYRYMVTRLIGHEPRRPPESQTWETEPRDVLLICSAYIHRNAAPSEYVQKLMDDHAEMLGCDMGMIALIRRGPPVPAKMAYIIR